jgi:1,4-dihydroxy-2-naphthoyl-CoA hydrolase
MTKTEILERMNAMSANTLMDTLEIKYTDLNIEEGWVKAQMPVNPRVHQPMGLLHGGATAALAESLGSASSVLYINPKKQAPVGVEISCNHLRSIREGMVFATAQIVHKGRSSHLWQIRVEDAEGRLISLCKLLNFIKDVE